jgi:hypothetical protein
MTAVLLAEALFDFLFSWWLMFSLPFLIRRLVRSVQLFVYPISNVGRTVDELDTGSFPISKKSNGFHSYQIHIAQVQDCSGACVVYQSLQVFQVFLLHSSGQSNYQSVSIKVFFDL